MMHYSKRFCSLVMLVVLIVSLCSCNSHSSFSSEEEMKNEVIGIYSLYEKHSFTNKMELSKQLKVSENMIVRRYPGLTKWHGTSGDEKIYITKWDFSNGIIEAQDEMSHERKIDRVTDTFTVYSNGKINYKNSALDETYTKGGNWDSDEVVNKAYNDNINRIKSEREIADLVLELTIDKVGNDSGYTICTGSVKNTGVNTYKFVKIKGAFKDANGNVIDTDWTYGVSSEGLEPGESSTFKLRRYALLGFVDSELRVCL